MVGRWILFPDPEKALSELIFTMVGVLINISKGDAVTVSLRDFFPADACAYVTWTYTCVALLVSSARSGKSVHTCLNLEMAGSSERIDSWIKRRLRSQNSF